MKLSRSFLTVVTAMGIVAVTSCNKASSAKADGGEPYIVHLNFDGDFDVDVDQDELTKAGASTNDAYAINVTYDGSTPYAYGLFDNTSDMTITLLSNHKYSVYCTLVKDAKNTLFYGQAFNNTYSGYAYPFQTSASGSTLVNNKFIIGNGVQFNGFGDGKAHLSGTTSPSTSNATNYASINRFYGRTTNYEPVPNGTINIYLKRVVFGAKFVVSGLQEGYADVKCGGFYNVRFLNNADTGERIYTFPNVYDTYNNDTPMVATVTVNYSSDRGKPWNLNLSQDVQFKRNVMTTVNIQLNPDLSGAQFNVTEEPMDEDNIIDMGINTDGYIDIIVNPEN